VTAVQRNKFWQFRNQANDSKVGELLLYGLIENSTWWGDEVTPKQFKKDMDALGEIDTLNVYINSEGGDPFAAEAIYSMLKRHKAEKVIHVDGLAASAATIPLMAGDRRIMLSNGIVMVHKAWTVAMGNSNDFRKLANDLEKIEEGVIAIYQQATKLEKEKIMQIMEEETWMTATEALEFGFITEIEKEKQVAACLDGSFLDVNGQKINLSSFKNPSKMMIEMLSRSEKPKDKLDQTQLLALESAINNKKNKYQEVK
jgi:ATP-dependent Clp protease protease subunit